MRYFTPEATLKVMYLVMALGLTPFSSPAGLARLDSVQWLCLGFCCLNTIVAYGCFSKAMAIWHTTGVGAVLSLTPLFSLACAWLAWWCFPTTFPDASLNLLGYVGALIVVLGAALLAIGPQILATLGKCPGRKKETPVPKRNGHSIR